MPVLTIAASGVRALLELAITKGASRTALIERAHIDPAELANADNRIPFARYIALMKAGQTLCNDPALALHFGEMVDVSEVSIAASIGGIENLDEALVLLNRYARLAVEVEGVGTSDRFQLQRTAGQIWLVDTRKNPNDFPELTESTFARMVCSTRGLLRGTAVFKAAHFTHAEPAYRSEYERILRVPVVFRSDKNALQVNDAGLASYRVPKSSGYVTELLKEHAEGLLDKLDGSQSFRSRIEALLTPALETGDTSVDMIAGQLSVSRQTLFRRLKEEGLTFEQVLDELRHRMALHYLSGSSHSVKQTARLVGFADATAFSRAFKRWTGSSPGAYVQSRDGDPTK